MRTLKKKVAVLCTFALAFSMFTNLSIGRADGRLTEFKDAMSRIKRSGTGSATSGYTESNSAIRSKFVVVAATNEQICIDVDGDGLDAAGCATDDDVIADIVDDSSLVSGNYYSGSELAAFVEEAIETAIRDAAADTDDSYTVTYNDSAVNSFVFANGVNEDISVSYDGVGPGDATVDLITDGGLTAHTAYTGAQVATALTTALSTGDANDNWTVTYDTATDLFTFTGAGGGDGIFIEDESASSAAIVLGLTNDLTIATAGTDTTDEPAAYINHFQVRGDGGNTLNPSIIWADATSTAAATLGYTANDTTIRTTVAVSDVQRQFNIIAGVNNTFELDLNGESSNGTETITVTAGTYTGTSLATQLQTDINTGWPGAGTVTVTYGSEMFTIASVATGTESYVHVESGTNDFLPMVDMINDIPKDGQATNVIVSSDHTLTFKTASAVPASGYVVLTFPSEFSFPTDLNFADIDFGTGASLSAITQRTLAAANGAGQVGATVDTGTNTITFHLATDSGITGDTYVEVKIGRNTSYGGTGIEQIINPAIPGMYQISAQTKTADTLTFTTGSNEDIVWDPDGVNAFVFADGINEEICFDTAGDGLDAAGCATDDDVLIDLIDDSAMAAGTMYTGSQVAAYIDEAMEADNGSADTYTVSYDTTTNTFTIEPDSGTTEAGLVWTDATSTAARVLGYTADDVDLYTVGIWTSDMVSGTYIADLVADGGLVSGAANTAANVATAIKTAIELAKFPNEAPDNVFDVTYSGATDKFTIADNTVDADEYPTFYWTWDESTAAYTLGYLADDTTTTDTFSYVSDEVSPKKQIDTAYTAVYIVDNDQITITAGVDPNLELEINGGLAYSSVEGDRDTLGVDFGALEPNAYYKLGGAKTEFIQITVNMNCGTGNEACIPETGDTITIRGQNYEFKRVAADAATATNYVYASITGTTQDQRAAKLLTNLYRSINSYDVNVRANIDHATNTVLWVMSTSEGPDDTLTTSAYNNEGGGAAELTVTTYTESDGSGAYSYFYKDSNTEYDPDMSSYDTDLSGISDFRGHNFKVNTNSADGYTLQIRDQGPDSTSPFVTWSDSTDLGFGLYAFSQSTRWGNVGNTADGDDLIAEAFQGGESNNVDPQGLTTQYQTLARNDVSTARDNISLEYIVRIDADQAAGNYQTTIEYMVTAQY